MFGVYTKAILSALAALAALISAATAFYASNNNGSAGSTPPGESSSPPSRVHGAPGPEIGVAGGIPAAIAVAYGLYLVSRRRKRQQQQ
jgi:hypothetical protein